MLSLAVITGNSSASDAIEQMAAESGIFKVVFHGSPATLTARGVIRGLGMHDPELILLDIGDWESVAALAGLIKERNCQGITVGFRPGWNRLEQLTFEETGINHLLREPFSVTELETMAYETLHKERGVTNQNILAFLPAKAGGGCSTVAIHTAAGLARSFPKNVLLIEGDRRSGVYSIMLNLEGRQGLDNALSLGNAMTPGEWHQHVVRIGGFHLLPASPKRRSPLPSWADYYQLLRFGQKQYDYLLVDLPEVVNEATAEVVRSARTVFIVCTPEIASLKMARFRAEELEACEIPYDRIQVVVNRLERGSPAVEDLEDMLERPVFWTLPNDYGELQGAILESRLASPDSDFADACRALARKLGGLPEEPPERSKFALLRRLSRIAG
jgi:MinD-like ATPase involved in chromosome partitioning or flagellar assembly